MPSLHPPSLLPLNNSPSHYITTPQPCSSPTLPPLHTPSNMEKSSMEVDMEMEEWELLPDKASLFNLSLDNKKDLYSKNLCCDPPQMLDLNYFICPPEKTIPAVLPNPITHSPIADKYEDDNDVIQCFRDMGVPPPPVIFANRDYASHVIFNKKMDEDEMIPQMVPETIVYEEKEVCKDQEFLKNMEFIQEKMAYKEEDFLEEDEGNRDACVLLKKNCKPCWEGFGLQIWRWRLNGIGKLCSIGVAAAAAALCIFILGGRQRQRQQQHQRLQFQMYTEDNRRIKQVMQQANRLNQALMRNVPIPRAQISFGGYYDGL